MKEKKESGEITTSIDNQQIFCKNCNNYYIGNFCPQCGQSAKEFDRPLRFFFLDVAGNIFAFDTRMWQSLRHVLLQPGRMETNYIAGKRIRYMPPFRLYVFVSFVFFLTLSWVTGRTISRNRAEVDFVNNQAITDSIYNDLSERYPGINFSQPGRIANLPVSPDNSAEHQITMQPETFANSDKIYRKMDHIMSNPGMYINRFFKYASWSLFLLMPFYGFLLWMNFRKSRRNYISHFLLSINQHVFIFVILLLILFADLVFPTKSIHPENYLLFLFPLYAWVGAVRLYQRHWFTTAIRLVMLICLYLFVAALVTVIIVYLSFVL